jgi:hypothetical protein
MLDAVMPRVASDTLNCPACNASNRYAALFCKRCGIAITQGAAAPQYTANGTRNFDRFGCGEPLLWAAFENVIYMLCRDASGEQAVRLRAGTITGEAPLVRLGKGPASADLVGPMIATRHGMFLPCRREVWFFKAHGPSGASSGLQRWRADEDITIHGATEGPRGEVWLLCAGPGKLTTLYCGNGQSPEWRPVVTLAQLYLEELEGAELLSIQDPTGCTIIGVAAGRKLVRFDSRTGEVVVMAEPKMAQIPLSLGERAQAGLFVTTAATMRDRTESAIPLLTRFDSSAGWAIAALSPAGFSLRPVSANRRPIAFGRGPNGSICAVHAKSVILYGHSGDELQRFVEAEKELFNAERASIAIGPAGSNVVIAVRPSSQDTAYAYILSPGYEPAELALFKREKDLSQVTPTLFPLWAADLVFIVAKQRDSCSIIYAPMPENSGGRQ